MRAAAERIVATEGPGALSVRRVAREAGTTTQAVYTLFNSKDGLTAALAEHAYNLLGDRLSRAVATEDPAADLVETGATVFRGFVLEHPSLYRIAFQRVIPHVTADPTVAEARDRAVERLRNQIRRADEHGLLGEKSVASALIEFNAVCEGMANVELRGAIMPLLTPGDEETSWREAFATLIRGFAQYTAAAPNTP